MPIFKDFVKNAIKKNEARPFKTPQGIKMLVVNSKTGDLTTHTLRFWEKEFKQVKPKVFAGRRRYYDKGTIELLKKIKFLLKDKGMTIKGAKNILTNKDSVLDDQVNTTINTKNILKSKLNKISKIVKELKK